MTIRVIVAALFVLTLSAATLANPGVWVGTPSEPDTVWIGHVPTNAFRVNPLMLAAGGLGGSFEHVFDGRHGILVEGDYHVWLKGSHYTRIAYLWHTPQYTTQPAILAPFSGVFARYGRLARPDPHERYNFELTTAQIGLLLGRQFLLGKYILCTGRIGLGFPVYIESRWSPEKPPFAELVEISHLAWVTIDLSLWVGVVF